MKQLAVPFQQLVQRRLWPLAVLLVAAAAAVPSFLSKEPEAPLPSSTAAPAAAQDDTTPIVARADDATIETERRVLGAPKDPFRPAVKAVAASTPTPASTPGGGTGTGTGTTPQPQDTPEPVSTGGGTPTVTTPVSTETPAPVATPEPEPKPTFPLYSLVVRFGNVTGPLTKRLVLRSTGLPSNGHVGLVYKGLLKDRRTAVFWVVQGAKVEGDGTCQPGPENCQYVRVKVGETLFVRLPGGDQYELDLLKVHAGKAEARAARAQASRALPKAVRGGAGRYRYDWRTGVLSEVTARRLSAEASSATGGVPIG